MVMVGMFSVAPLELMIPTGARTRIPPSISRTSYAWDAYLLLFAAAASSQEIRDGSSRVYAAFHKDDARYAGFWMFNQTYQF